MCLKNNNQPNTGYLIAQLPNLRPLLCTCSQPSTSILPTWSSPSSPLLLRLINLSPCSYHSLAIRLVSVRVSIVSLGKALLVFRHHRPPPTMSVPIDTSGQGNCTLVTACIWRNHNSRHRASSHVIHLAIEIMLKGGVARHLLRLHQAHQMSYKTAPCNSQENTATLLTIY